MCIPLLCLPMNSRLLIAASTFVLGASAISAYRGLSPTAHSAQTALAAADDHFFTSGGVTLHYREIGQGEPVVLLHDFGARLESWSPLADSLARNFRVIVPDLRGFGQSSKPATASGYGHHWVDDVVGLLDQLGKPTAHVIGHSLGGAVAINLALDHPARVASLTLVAPAIWHDSLDAAQMTEPFLNALRSGDGAGALATWRYGDLPDSTSLRQASELLAQNNRGALAAALQSLPALMVPGHRMQRSQTPALALTSLGDPFVHGTNLVAGHWPELRVVELESGGRAGILHSQQLLTEFRQLATRALWP